MLLTKTNYSTLSTNFHLAKIWALLHFLPYFGRETLEHVILFCSLEHYFQIVVFYSTIYKNRQFGYWLPDLLSHVFLAHRSHNCAGLKWSIFLFILAWLLSLDMFANEWIILTWLFNWADHYPDIEYFIRSSKLTFCSNVNDPKFNKVFCILP